MGILSNAWNNYVSQNNANAASTMNLINSQVNALRENGKNAATINQRQGYIDAATKVTDGVSSAASALSGALSGIGDKVEDIIDKYKTGSPSSPTYGSDSGSSDGSGPTAASEIDYLNADLAKHYGMDASTAYQEALSNTGYQRAVKDMKEAGLNPAVLFSSGYSSNGVSYATPASDASGSSGSSGSYGSSGSGSALLSKDAYNLVTTGAGLLTAAATKSVSGYNTGKTISSAVISALNSAKSLFG